MSERPWEGRRYVLVTAAYNEERHIETLIASILAQTLRPFRWVIVSDGSIDGTEALVRQYSAENEFIELVRISEDHPRNFAAQVNAINVGLARLKETKYDFIGNVDADMSFEPEYFSDLLSVFAKNPALGLAGGWVCEMRGGEFRSRPLNQESSVAHAVQLFRRACFRSLGSSYVPLPYGGPDWYAGVKCRMNGWGVGSVPGLKAFHHRPPDLASGWLRTAFRQGKMDYSLGTHPLFECLRLMRRLQCRPIALYALVRAAAFVFSYAKAEKRIVSDEFVQFLRKEELERLRRIPLKFKGKMQGAGV